MSPRARLRAAAPLAVLLLVLTGCTDRAAAPSESADGGSTASPVVNDGDGSDAVDPDEVDPGTPGPLPHAPGDPCEGVRWQDQKLDFHRNPDSPNQCDLIAWVDLDGDEIAEPVAIGTTSGPSIFLRTVVGGRTLTFDPREILPVGHPPQLGPLSGTMEQNRRDAFAGAFDVTGDGTPELVMWINSDLGVRHFNVVRYVDGRLEAISAPNEGMWAVNDRWAHAEKNPVPTYECDPDAGTLVTHDWVSNGGPESFDQITVHEFSAAGGRFETTRQAAPADEPWTGNVSPSGFACTDRAEYA